MTLVPNDFTTGSGFKNSSSYFALQKSPTFWFRLLLNMSIVRVCLSFLRFLYARCNISSLKPARAYAPNKKMKPSKTVSWKPPMPSAISTKFRTFLWKNLVYGASSTEKPNKESFKSAPYASYVVSTTS